MVSAGIYPGSSYRGLPGVAPGVPREISLGITGAFSSIVSLSSRVLPRFSRDFCWTLVCSELILNIPPRFHFGISTVVGFSVVYSQGATHHNNVFFLLHPTLGYVMFILQ